MNSSHVSMACIPLVLLGDFRRMIGLKDACPRSSGYNYFTSSLKKKIICLTGIDLWETSILTAWPHTYLLFQTKNYIVVDKIKISF